ncbi:MAG: aspartate aminotransferase family protein [Rhodobacteraceae bacterium]|nr:aspartate aminotransferase family protein [Paracoccaceae bacterium]
MSSLTKSERAALETAFDHAVSYRESLEDRPVFAEINLATTMERFFKPLPEHGEPAQDVIKQMIADGDQGLLQIGSGRFFGFVMGGSDPTGIAADVLVSAWGQNSANSGLMPTTGAIERTVCEWVIKLLGLPDESGAGLVTGGTLANTTGVMAARNALLRRLGWDVEAKGLFGAPEIQVIIGEEAHSATFAALRYAGLGAERVHKIPVDDNGTMNAAAFADVFDKLSGPILVILQAGHINSGGFDPFDQIIPKAREKDSWVHVDGAFGLWLNAVPELAPRLNGVELADSWAIDLHKWLNAPFDAGMVIVRDRETLFRSMSAKGAYLAPTSDIWDASDSVMELSRRARGVPSYAILRSLGVSGVREMITRHCRLAQRFAREVSAIDGLAVLNDPTANQVAFTCAEGEEGDRLTQHTLERIHQNGRVYPSHGEWKGRKIIRVSITNHRTNDADIDLLLSEIVECWDYVQGKNSR